LTGFGPEADTCAAIKGHPSIAFKGKRPEIYQFLNHLLRSPMNAKFQSKNCLTAFPQSFRYAAFLIVLVAGLLSLTNNAIAQLAGKGAVSGTILDPTGAAVPGATIVITKNADNVATTTTSTSAGDYSISTLDAGVYTITVTAQGFEKLTQQNVQVNSLETQTFSPKLTIGATDQTITVSTLPPQLETTNATLGATMENDMYSALPIEMGAYGQPDQRRATDFAFLMPGVQGNNTSGNPTTNTGIVNGSGSKGAVSDVYVDGVAFVRAGGNGDPRYVWTAISVDAVDQFQVQTSGYSALYEGQGIQNYTIKQGGSNFHGSVYEFFRNTALDTWGFFGPANLSPVTHLPVKPIENSNEYGINLSGPLVPFGRWKDKVFFYGNYNGFRYASSTPIYNTFPTLAEQSGNFQGLLAAATTANLTNSQLGVFDPSTQNNCTAKSSNGPCRYRYGYVASGTVGPNGNPVLGPGGTAAVDVIPSSEFSSVALKMQSYIPALTNQSPTSNYLAANKTGLVNWSTTDRIDYIVGPKDTLTFVAAIGRQASSNPVGQTTSGRGVGPIPYNYGQAYAPKTAVGVIEESHIFTEHLVNQIKYGYARYNGPTFDSDEVPAYAASAQGISGQPVGAAQQGFPITTFSGVDAPTQWAGTTPGVTLAENYTLVDNLQWVKGKHTLTFGGQIAWLLYNVVNATGGSTPLTLATAATETEGITSSSNTAPKYAGISNTGLPYASFLVGQIDKLSFTDYLQQEFGARFRPISPYVQDNWKITPTLTADIGLRWDYYPSIREVHDAESYFSPTLANPVTGANGALAFTGHGTGTCNCDTPVENWYKNFGPRIGLAWQIDPKTVVRASYGIMFSHGGAVGGSASSLGTLGFSAAPSFSASGTLLSTAPFTGINGAIPTYALASGVASGPAYGTGYTTVAGYTGTPSSIGYDDPYLGSRAPEFINYNFGFQHQWTTAFTSTISYVGSQGHFLPVDSGSPRGYWSDGLDPKYLTLNSNLTLLATPANCTTAGVTCPANFTPTQAISSALKPFPFQTVSDSFGYSANANYNALQISLNMRPWHGLTFMGNYTWSRSIDDGGTFRTGYAIPAGTLANEPNVSFKADRIERSVSTTNQPQHVVVTGVYQLPFGKDIFNGNSVERAIIGGFKLSEVFQAFSGSPLSITASSCQTNPAQSCNEANYNPNFSGPARVNGKWGQGITAINPSAISYIAPSAGTATAPTGPFIAPSLLAATTALPNGSPFAPLYTFANGARTAAYNLYGPGNYNLDLALVRSFPLHITESSHLELRAEWYNITNHTWFAVASSQVGNASFGTVGPNASAPRKSFIPATDNSPH
jgi:hypothetical protein